MTEQGNSSTLGENDERLPMSNRFRSFLPVVVDVETGGFNCNTDALLEIAAVLIEIQGDGTMKPGESYRYHVEPFEGANIEPAALEVNGIDPTHPLRLALPEKEALQKIFREIRQAVRDNDCTRAVLVGHNSFFDLGFVNAAAERAGIKRNPFHQFTSFDTATLGGAAFGQTVLSRIAKAAGFEWDSSSAHSALYDARITADIFCTILNGMKPVYETLTNPSQE